MKFTVTLFIVQLVVINFAISQCEFNIEHEDHYFSNIEFHGSANPNPIRGGNWMQISSNDIKSVSNFNLALNHASKHYNVYLDYSVDGKHWLNLDERIGVEENIPKHIEAPSSFEHLLVTVNEEASSSKLIVDDFRLTLNKVLKSVRQEGAECLHVSVSPNPASAHSRITIENHCGGSIECAVYNSQGALVQQFAEIDGLKYLDLDMSKLPSGHYTITTSSEDQVVVEQLIKL